MCRTPLVYTPCHADIISYCCPLAGLCYFGVAILGFYAFGTGVSENVLMAFENGANHWVVAMANMMVVVHVASAYQVGLCTSQHKSIFLPGFCLVNHP